MSNKIYLDKPEENLGFLLWHTNMHWQRELNRALDTVGITHTQFAIISALLALLKESSSVTQKEIANRSSTDTMMVSKILRTLEKKGIIKRKQHKKDTRAKCVFLTQKGIEMHQKALKIAIDSNTAFFSTLENEDNFRHELQKLIQIDKSN